MPFLNQRKLLLGVFLPKKGFWIAFFKKAKQSEVEQYFLKPIWKLERYFIVSMIPDQADIHIFFLIADSIKSMLMLLGDKVQVVCRHFLFEYWYHYDLFPIIWIDACEPHEIKNVEQFFPFFGEVLMNSYGI